MCVCARTCMCTFTCSASVKLRCVAHGRSRSVVCTACDSESWSSYEYQYYTRLSSVQQHDPKNFHITSVKKVTVHRVLVMYCWFMCRVRQANSKRWIYLRKQETPLQSHESSSLSISTRVQRMLEGQSLVHWTGGRNPTNNNSLFIRGDVVWCRLGWLLPFHDWSYSLCLAMWPHW